jgi:hypothetical protein
MGAQQLDKIIRQLLFREIIYFMAKVLADAPNGS